MRRPMRPILILDEDTARAAARMWGSRGGRKNTPAQQAQRHSPKPYAGRPKGSKNRPKLGPAAGLGPVSCGRGCLKGDAVDPARSCGLGRPWAEHETRTR